MAATASCCILKESLFFMSGDCAETRRYQPKQNSLYYPKVFPTFLLELLEYF
jgi:hypothetical protein